MPTYQYECRACGQSFEREQSITEPALTRCPECGGEVRRVISGGSGFMFKGGGQGRIGRSGKGCSLEQTGKTCCGRAQRCDKPPCGSGK